MKCLLDMDGLSVDFCRGVKERYDVPSTLEYPATPWPWNWIFDFHGIDQKEFWPNLEPEFWENLPWTPEGQEIVRLVEEFFGPKNVCLLTNPSGNDAAIIGKIRWIKKHMPQYERRWLMGEPKEFCAGSDHVLIDDANHNIDDFREAGGKVILFPREWNRGHNVINRVEYLKVCLNALRYSHGRPVSRPAHA